MAELNISANTGYYRRGRTGALNDQLRVAAELMIPAVHAASVDFAVASDRMNTHSYVNGDAKLDTYETTIVQQWARYMASHASFSECGVVWEAKFRRRRRGRPPAVDIVIESARSIAEERAALIEVKVSETGLDESGLWADAKKLWELTVAADDNTLVPVEAARVVVNVVSGLANDVGPAEFEGQVKALAAKSESWDPRFVAVFSAVFPVFRPSPRGRSSERPMWIKHGVAAFELKPCRSCWSATTLATLLV